MIFINRDNPLRNLAGELFQSNYRLHLLLLRFLGGPDGGFLCQKLLPLPLFLVLFLFNLIFPASDQGCTALNLHVLLLHFELPLHVVVLLKDLELLLFLFQGTFITHLLLFLGPQPGRLSLKSILLHDIIFEHSCAVLSVKFFLILLPLRLNALPSLGSLEVLDPGGSPLGALAPSLIAKKDFVLFLPVKLGDFVRLRHGLVQVLQLFLLVSFASDCRVDLLHLVDFLVVR